MKVNERKKFKSQTHTELIKMLLTEKFKNTKSSEELRGKKGKTYTPSYT